MSGLASSIDAVELLDRLKTDGIVQRFEKVGSRVTCNPAPIDTDEDWLVAIKDYGKAFDQFQLLGFEVGGSFSQSEIKGMSFLAFRNGEINLILTTSQQYYDRFLVASSVAKHLNLMVKADRIILFDAVIFGRKAGSREAMQVNAFTEILG